MLTRRASIRVDWAPGESARVDPFSGHWVPLPYVGGKRCVIRVDAVRALQRPHVRCSPKATVSHQNASRR